MRRTIRHAATRMRRALRSFPPVGISGGWRGQPLGLLALDGGALAMRYALSRWDEPIRLLHDGRIESTMIEHAELGLAEPRRVRQHGLKTTALICPGSACCSRAPWCSSAITRWSRHSAAPSAGPASSWTTSGATPPLSMPANLGSTWNCRLGCGCRGSGEIVVKRSSCYEC